MSRLRTRADAAAQVLVDDVTAPSLAEADVHHLRRVLRLRDGEQVIACDGRGSWRRCAMAAGDVLEASGDVVVDPAPDVPVTVWLPAVKGDRTEWAVAKLTELGVDSIGLLELRSRDGPAQRRGRGPRARPVATRERARRSASPGAPGSPTLLGPVGVAAAAGLGAMRCDLDGELPATSTCSLMVGPEGGWGDEERAAGSASVTLGETVLRTETAAVVAGDAARRRGEARRGPQGAMMGQDV